MSTETYHVVTLILLIIILILLIIPFGRYRR